MLMNADIAAQSSGICAPDEVGPYGDCVSRGGLAEYHSMLNDRLPAPSTGGSGPLVVDLFAGCGGLAVGFESQGFSTAGFEMDSDCCDTYQKNLSGRCEQVVLTPETPLPQTRVLIGGPPCQPFSVGGHQAGLADSRDGFPIFISAVDRLRPDIWMFENVRGLFYRNRGYLAEIIESLQALDYEVEARLLNAKHFDVPQNRERIIVVGHRGGFAFPQTSRRVYTAGEALGAMAFDAPPGSRFLTPNQDEYVERYERASQCIRPRDLHLDRPARTLTCRNLAGATGDMQRVRLPDGRRRRLTAREAARLQSFPDWFQFAGGETSIFNQIGNAVPPMLASHLAAAVRAYLEGSDPPGQTGPRPLKTSVAHQLSFEQAG
jgi:DNA (cytosine-5)-methyltransferase 1